MTRIRIFISSPGDVAAEREKARTVIGQLARQYGEQVELLPVLWEDLPLQADSSFQQGIDVVLSSEHGIDIAVFILWNRLGSPLGSAIRRADGGEYRSGTEREFELMLEARRQSGGRRPALIAYSRSDAQGFLEGLKGQDTSEIESALAQRKLAEGFIREFFHDEEGHNIRAYHSFSDPVSFATRLRVHLRGLIDELLGASAPAGTWSEPPYRGLALFDREHAPIFRGREEEICELALLLRQRAAQSGCAFVVVIGTSGSGKSSLVRAGLAANLVDDNVDSDVREWRCAVMLPSGANGDPFSGLARALGAPGALPELLQDGPGIDDLGDSLRNAPQQALRLAIAPALAAATRAAGGPARLLLIVDQLEELHTDLRIDADRRSRFLELLELFARCGDMAVVATLRSDFFPLAQKDEAFLRLKGRDGQFDLGAPSLAAMRRIVVEPAWIAGLRFEQRGTGSRLDDLLLGEAAQLVDALPLVEFALRELYEQREGSLMTFRAFEVMGGVKGAIGTRAEAVFASLPPAAQSAFASVFRHLVTLERVEPSRRWAPREEITRTPDARALVDRLVSERFLTATRDNETSVIGIAHEALLGAWARLREFVDASRDALRRRARLELAHARWLEQPNDDSLLLAPGRPLDEAEWLLAETPDIVPEPLARYVAGSRTHHAKLRAARRRQRGIAIGVATALTLVAIAGAALAWLQQREAGLAQRRASALHQVHQGDGLLERGDWPAALALFETAYRAAPDFATRSALLRGMWNIDPRLQQAIHGLPAPPSALGFTADGMVWSGDGKGALAQFDLGQRRCARCDPAAQPARADALMDVRALRTTGTGGVIAIRRDGLVLRVASGESAPQVSPVPCADNAACEIGAAAISRDGRWLAASDAESPRARLWSSTANQPAHHIESPDGGRITAIDVDATGAVIALGTEQGGVYAYATDTRRMSALRAGGASARVTALAWGGAGLLASGHANGEVLLTSTGATADSRVLAQGAPVTALAWSPDATRLAVASGKVLQVFATGSAASSARPLGLPGHRRAILALAWSADGTRLASGSDDRALQVWTLDGIDSPFAARTDAHDELHGLAVSADGALTAAGTRDGRVCVWSAMDGQPATCFAGGHRAPVLALAWHPDEPLLMSADDTGVIRGWNWPGERPFTPQAAQGRPHAHRGAVWSLKWTDDGRLLASAGYDGELRLWDRASDTALTVARMPDLALGMDVSPDGRHLAAASTDGVIRVWPLGGSQDGAAEFTLPLAPDAGHGESVGALAFSHDGVTLASAGNDGTVRLWDVRARRLRAVSPDIGVHVESVAFAGDDGVLASTGGDGQLRVWDSASLEPLLALPVHRAPAWRVAWNPDGHQFVTASADATLATVTWSESAWSARLHALLGKPAGQSEPAAPHHGAREAP